MLPAAIVRSTSPSVACCLCSVRRLTESRRHNVHLEPQTTIYKWDVWWKQTIFYIKIWNHPIETTIYKWLFGVPGSGRIINWRSLITSLLFALWNCRVPRELQHYVKVQKLRITAMSAISNWNCLLDHRRMMVNSFNSKPPVWSFGRNHML